MNQLSLPSTSGGLADLERGVAELRRDLKREDGPGISTMRNFRFAILAYDPEHEFRLRQHVSALTHDLRGDGWVVLPLSLQALLLDRLRREGDDFVDRLVTKEKHLYARGAARALRDLRDRVAPIIEGHEGIASDVVRAIERFADEHPDKADRAVAFVGRAGALYPSFRTSALLKHIDGRTRNVPVVLLYPGKRRGKNGLSFMGEYPPDTDYRPRIYPT